MAESYFKRLADELNKPNYDVLNELIAEDFKDHIPGLVEPLNREQFTASIHTFHKAFPGVQVEVDEIIYAGDKEIVRARAFGKHAGVWGTVPATNKDLAWTAIAILRIENNKIAERWEMADVFSLFMGMEAIDIKYEI